MSKPEKIQVSAPATLEKEQPKQGGQEQVVEAPAIKKPVEIINNLRAINVAARGQALQPKTAPETTAYLAENVAAVQSALADADAYVNHMANSDADHQYVTILKGLRKDLFELNKKHGPKA